MLAGSTLIALNEATLIASGHVWAAAVVSAFLVVFLANAAIVVEWRARSAAESEAAAAGFRALALVAVIPLAAAALPLRHVSLSAAELVAAVSLGVAILCMPSQLSLIIALLRRPANIRSQAAIATAGLPLGLAVYFLRPESVPAATATGYIMALTAAAATAVVEELLFRGVLQQALMRALGYGGVAIAAVLFTATYSGSGWPLLPVAVAAALFSIGVHRSGVLWGALIGHVVLSVGAVVVWPAVFGDDPSTVAADLAVAPHLGARVVQTIAALKGFA
jgi:membrane protease YdiL (CAAX protease family)